MEEKGQIKKQKLRQKEERKQQLEKRRQEKAELAAEKKRQKESKAVQKSKERKCTQGPKKTTEHGPVKKGKTADGRGKSGGESITSFTEKEIKLFETRLENGLI